MKHQSTIDEIDRRGVTRGAAPSPHAILRNLEEAAVLAFESGKYAEFDRLTHSIKSQNDKVIQAERRYAELVPLALIWDLGGNQDGIVTLMKKRRLTVIHGKVAQLLREHVEGETIEQPGRAEFIGYVDGAGNNDVAETRHDARERGRRAWACARRRAGPEYAQAVSMAIQGRRLTDAAHAITGRHERAMKMLPIVIKGALDEAGAYIGGVR